MLLLATQELQRLPYADVRGFGAKQGGVGLEQRLVDFAAGIPLTLFAFLRQSETLQEDVFQVVRGKEGEVGCLDARHLVVAEPVGNLLHQNFVHDLRIELFVVDGRSVVDKLILSDIKAEITSAASRIGERMRVVRCGQEGGIARTIFLRATENGSSVNLHLRKRLLESSLLSHGDVGKLVDIDQQVVSQRHITFKFVSKVDVVEVVGTQVLGKDPHGEGAFATSLRADEDG